MYRVFKAAYEHALDVAEATKNNVDIEDVNGKRERAAAMVREMVLPLTYWASRLRVKISSHVISMLNPDLR